MLVAKSDAQIKDIPMIDYKIELPTDFDDYAWEVESKGWLNDIVVSFEGVRYRVVFYDPTRLAQDIDEDLEENAVFLESNILVVKTVNRNYMEKAIEFIAQTGKYIDMMKESDI
jgi:hypothetical protein